VLQQLFYSDVLGSLLTFNVILARLVLLQPVFYFKIFFFFIYLCLHIYEIINTVGKWGKFRFHYQHPASGKLKS